MMPITEYGETKHNRLLEVLLLFISQTLFDTPILGKLKMCSRLYNFR
jgi:hypothetical protein